MFAFDPTNGIIQLIHVVGELRITAIVQQAFIGRTRKLDTRKCSLLNSGETDLRGIVLAKAVGDLTAETAAESEKKLIHERRSKNVVVTDAGISCILRGSGTEKRAKIGNAPGVGVVVIEAAGNSVPVRNDVVDLDIKQVCRGARDGGARGRR